LLSRLYDELGRFEERNEAANKFIQLSQEEQRIKFH